MADLVALMANWRLMFSNDLTGKDTRSLDCSQTAELQIASHHRKPNRTVMNQNPSASSSLALTSLTYFEQQQNVVLFGTSMALVKAHLNMQCIRSHYVFSSRITLVNNKLNW